jgi:hypothetical protein
MATIFMMNEEIARGMVCFFHQKKHSYLINLFFWRGWRDHFMVGFAKQKLALQIHFGVSSKLTTQHLWLFKRTVIFTSFILNWCQNEKPSSSCWIRIIPRLNPTCRQMDWSTWHLNMTKVYPIYRKWQFGNRVTNFNFISHNSLSLTLGIMYH